MYEAIIRQVVDFFKSGVTPVDIEDTFEVMRMLDAADRAYRCHEEVAI
jgi:hypothetical protein